MDVTILSCFIWTEHNALNPARARAHHFAALLTANVNKISAINLQNNKSVYHVYGFKCPKNQDWPL